MSKRWYSFGMNHESKALFGARVREARLSMGMKQSELAEAAGVSRGTIVNIEAGRHSPQDGVRARVERALALNFTPGDTDLDAILSAIRMLLKSLDADSQGRAVVDILSVVGSYLPEEAPTSSPSPASEAAVTPDFFALAAYAPGERARDREDDEGDDVA